METVPRFPVRVETQVEQHEGGRWRLEMNESGNEPSDALWLFSEIVKAEILRTNGSAQEGEPSVVTCPPAHQSFGRVYGGMKGHGQDLLALRRAQAFREDCEEGLRGLAGATRSSVVEEEGHHVQRATAGLGNGELL